MTAISEDQLVALKAFLEKEYVPHLPPLLNPSSVTAKNGEKNICRALAGFAIATLCGIEPSAAAKYVVDDGDDYGIDAIYYQAISDTLYLVQAKLKTSSFAQDDALAFCQGLRKIINQDFSGFNANIANRQVEIEDAVSNCSHILPVVIHTGPGLVTHAVKALADCLDDEREDDERIALSIEDYGSERIVACLRESHAYRPVNTKLTINPWRYDDQPRKAYFGFVALKDLVALFRQHGFALFSKNLRNPLGSETDVAKAVRDTLANKPQDFVYFNNGVTALCKQIIPKDTKRTGKRLDLKDLSVINGAQTISSASYFAGINESGCIDSARVMITLIEDDGDEEFSKLVTRARNHQNTVTTKNFAALDDEQERLRRDLAAIGVHYAYKADDMSGGQDPSHIRIEEAARSLAITQFDPRYAVWIKKEPGQLLDTEQSPYKGLFTAHVTAFEVANSVRLLRYVETQMVNVERSAGSPERLAYRHGVFALGFVMAKHVSRAVSGTVLLDPAKLRSELSLSFDSLRENLWNEVRGQSRSALTVFRSQALTLPLLVRVMIAQFGVPNDARLAAERANGNGSAGYPKALFDYLCSRAPQIGNLT